MYSSASISIQASRHRSSMIGERHICHNMEWNYGWANRYLETRKRRMDGKALEDRTMAVCADAAYSTGFGGPVGGCGRPRPGVLSLAPLSAEADELPRMDFLVYVDGSTPLLRGGADAPIVRIANGLETIFTRPWAAYNRILLGPDDGVTIKLLTDNVETLVSVSGRPSPMDPSVGTTPKPCRIPWLR